MDILMPQLGETVAEGKITKWFKAPGDAVKPGDNLFEIETDKTAMEVPAIAAGVLTEIRVREGDVAPVGAVVGVLGGAMLASTAAQAPVLTRNESRPALTRVPVPTDLRAPAPQPIKLDPFREVRTPERNFGPARLAGGTIVTPLARRLAAEAGIDLGQVAPTSTNRRISARDVEAAITNGAGARPPADRAPTGDPQRIIALYEPGSFEELALDNMRRTIATRLTEAVQTIPHFCLSIDLTTERLVEIREETNATAPAAANGEPSYRLSLNDFLLKAWGLALRRVSTANAVWAHDRILRFSQSDIGIAVATEGGLLTPVVRKADTKSVIDISAEMNDLTARARARRLKPHEYQGGASAISNLGMYGVREFAAIINPPHATILAIGAAERRPIETMDGFRFVSRMTVTLSCDHRIVDGALGGELLGVFKSLVEHPVGLLV
ncbi:MAG: 2-oxo acid dehydrogenase subunit E2 [Xanthobacteraceae bacterium]|nr:2-oxo acid dehydrogenase subunit E2 [Xanthobacteraceae bacterium]